ncbi:MAG: FkbM family methyltransferase [Pseudomonadota bacterium]
MFAFLHAIKETAKRIAEAVFLDRVFLTQRSDPDRVRRLIRKLHAHEPDHPLIRIGGAEDGGYLIPDDLDGIRYCISPGVSEEITFDLDMANRDMHVIMADASVDGPPVEHRKFTFHKKFLGLNSDETFMRLDQLCDAVPESQEMILQMDIEGAEYGILLDVSDNLLKRFRIIILELHGLSNAFDAFSLPIIEAFVEKLSRYHAVVHIHPNNCCGSMSRSGIEIPRVMELTFTRRDRGVSAGPVRKTYPHPLDVDNVAEHPSLNLADLWKG